MRKALRFVALAAVVAMAFACAASDPGITTKIKTQLAADDTVKAYQIDVDTKDKVVTLSGNVETQAAKDRAGEIARATTGVADVVNNITVGTASAAMPGEYSPAGGEGGGGSTVAGVIDDAAVTTSVKTKLLADSTVGGLKIDVDTKEGVVTLTGNVKSQAEADAAVRIARETEGVKDVVSNLTIGAASK
jgi:hyperosmotically inducible protein